MPKREKIVTINSRKFDGKIHRSWKARWIKKKGSLLVFVGEFEEEVKHSNLGLIRRGTLSYEYYWLNRFYNVFRFHEPDDSLRNFYCNINLPPTFENYVLDYVDLDIDVLVWQDFSFEILDLDDFAENSKKYGYSKELIQKVEENLKGVLDLIENKKFPFNTHL